MVLDAPYPEDGRVTKEAVALMRAGHEVYLLCVRRPGEPRREEVAGVRVRRLRRGTSLFAKTAWDSVNALLWRHPVFARGVRRFVAEDRIEVLHVHDLPLAGTVAAVARRREIPWVLDLHENFPAGLQIWMEHKTNPLVRLKNKLLMSYDRWEAYEGRMVGAASRVIAVVDEMRERLTRVHGTPTQKISIVTNSEWRDFMEQFQSVDEVARSYPGKFVILYLGYFGPHRGVDTVVEAMPAVVERIPEAVFVVVGRGSYQPYLEGLAARLGMTRNVDFAGFKPYAEVGSWMQRADVNIIPHKRNDHTDNTVPHKLFQSLLAGKATVVSDAPPLKRLAEETGGAFVFEAENAGSLAQLIVRLASDPEAVRARANSGLAAAREGRFNWDTDQQHLLEIYSDFIRG